jgi:hypothetical protein
MLWSWILEIIGMTGAFFVGRKHWQAWSILIINAILWVVYGVATHQYGFAAASLFYGPIYTRNLLKWRKSERAGKSPL